MTDDPSRTTEASPPDLILVGRVGEAFGLKGGVHLIPYSAEAVALQAARQWWLEGPGKQALRSIEVLSAKTHGDGLTAQLIGVADRDAAQKLKGAMVYVPRSRFPVLDDDEYYWTDLIGLEVVTVAGQRLGTVSAMIESGAHPILDVVGEGDDDKPVQRLIPFVGVYVKSVQRDERRIVVDWGLDF